SVEWISTRVSSRWWRGSRPASSAALLVAGVAANPLRQFKSLLPPNPTGIALREPLAKMSEVVEIKQNGPILFGERPRAELSCCCPQAANREAHMKLNLRQQITQFAHVLQTQLFPS